MMPSVDGSSLMMARRFSTKMSSIQVGCMCHSSADFVFCSDPTATSIVDMDDLTYQLKLANQLDPELLQHVGRVL